MTIATNDIEQAQKKINELESLKQTALNRLIEIGSLERRIEGLDRKLEMDNDKIETLNNELAEANLRNEELTETANDLSRIIQSIS